jgi:hypothetical protein
MEKKLLDEEIKELIALHRKTKDKKMAVRINSVIFCGLKGGNTRTYAKPY